MAKLNKRRAGYARNAPAHVIKTSPVADGRTALGGLGFSRDVKGELYLLGVTNMVSEKTFHEAASARDSRFSQLVRQAAVEYPEWTLQFLRWLRQGANMRSAPIVGVAEFIKGRLDAGARDEVLERAHLDGQGYVPKGINRRIITEVFVRPDEPADAISYWIGQYGRNLPMPLKRGVADVTAQLYNEWSLLRYDSEADAVRFGDVIALTHPVPYNSALPGFETKELFKHAIDKRHKRVFEPTSKLPMITANMLVRRSVAAGDYALLLDPDALKAAGLSWQDALSLAGNKVDKAKLWEALIPTMGYQALLMNLRNFDQAGVSDAVAATVVNKLSDPRQVARSRMLPMQFLAAYRAVSSLRWSQAINTALELSLRNIPELPGRTLILVDTSYSMNAGFSKDGTLQRWDAAVIFGLALAKRCAQADVISFSDRTMRFPAVLGEALLVGIKRWKDTGFFIDSGTETGAAVRAHYTGQDRVVVLTDEQAAYWGQSSLEASRMAEDVFTGSVPASIPTYTWNLAGYKEGHAAGTANRHTFGGLTDAAFKMIPLLESNHDGSWPWENAGIEAGL